MNGKSPVPLSLHGIRDALCDPYLWAGVAAAVVVISGALIVVIGAACIAGLLP